MSRVAFLACSEHRIQNSSGTLECLLVEWVTSKSFGEWLFQREQLRVFAVGLDKSVQGH